MLRIAKPMRNVGATLRAFRVSQRSTDQPERKESRCDDSESREKRDSIHECPSEMIRQSGKRETISNARQHLRRSSRRVDTLQILGEPVEQTAERLRVEEAERSAKDGVEDQAVESVTGADRACVENEPGRRISECRPHEDGEEHTTAEYPR